MICFRKQIDEIRAASTIINEDGTPGDPYRDHEVHRKVAALHGITNWQPYDPYADNEADDDMEGAPNKHGVFTNGETISLADDNDRFCRGEIRIVQTPASHWLMAISYALYQSGGGSLPGIWERQGYESREEAIEAGLDKLIVRANSAMNDREPGYHKAGARLIEMVDSYRMSKNQLSLF